jgi:rhamnose utilization protein RhaD (predicted bifunctional aldolase and dehydrogenase)
MNKLDTLINISRYFGANPDYVIAGGGNTSFKDQETLWVKASGIYLVDIGMDGFVALSREKLGAMETRTYSRDPLVREEEVKNDLKAATISPGGLRPSVETSLHNLIGYAFIVHTHPTLVNAVMCSQHAGQEVEERFGSEALYVEYTDPGYVLFKKLQERTARYHDTHGADPGIIFLQNHGVFVGAETTDEIRAVYDSIESRIRAGKNLVLPGHRPEEYSSEASRAVSGLFAARGLVTGSYKSALISHFTAGRSSFRKVSRPFTPDQIVYCRSNYLFLERETGKEGIRAALEQFEKLHGYLPKVILEEAGGLIIAEENEQCIRTVQEVFTDMMKVSFLSEQFGGPHFMGEEQIRTIDQWEVENYRRSVARSRGSV